jgi:hypothetical protein
VKRNYVLGSDDGNILIMAVVIVGLLVATGLGYMQWSSDERYDSAYEEATIQAFFLAQTGLIEQGLTFLRTREPTDLPQGTVLLPSGVVPNVGIHYNNRVSRVMALGSGNVFQRTDTYDLYSTGRTEFANQHIANRDFGRPKKVERTATMRARLRSFANYMYLTNIEQTQFDEIIWFWTPDTLWGRTHSNDFIGLKYSPTFFGPVSTCKDRFIYNQPGNIHFEYPPMFNVPPVYFPTTATSIRRAANPFISDHSGRFMTWLRMRGAAGIDVFQYPLGLAPRESLIAHLNPPNWQAMFIDGQCEIEGVLSGTLTIGSAGDMWLIDDIRYDGSNVRTGFFGDDTPMEGGMVNMLGLVSEKNVIIADNNKNGKADGIHVSPNDWGRHSIAINAGIVALGESFTFQHQNDDFEAYQGPTPDERGWIYLKGAVTQWRRGYVHRSNHGTGQGNGTGYGKAYHYDFRFDRRPPPYYLEALDENGHGLFDIVSWGEQTPTR